MSTDPWTIFKDMCTRGPTAKADVRVECQEMLDATRGFGRPVLAFRATNGAAEPVVLTGLFLALDDGVNDPPRTLQIHADKWDNKTGFTELPHVLEPGAKIEIRVPRDHFYRTVRHITSRPGRYAIRCGFWTDNFTNRHTSEDYPFRTTAMRMVMPTKEDEDSCNDEL